LIGLASGLLALAGVFAARGAVVAREQRIAAGLGVRRKRDRRPAISPWVTVPPIAALSIWLIGAIPTALTGAALFVGVLVRRRRIGSRARTMALDQLVDAVVALTAALRAGLSLTQAIASARDEAFDPLRPQLERVLARIEMGIPLSTALQEWGERDGTDDVRLIVGVLDLYRQSGGDLPAVLDGLAETLRERRAADRELRALTAQARLSGVILGVLPIAFFCFLLLTSRREMLDAIATPLGGAAIGIGVGLELLAFLWIRHLLEAS
jgi:tight adherence protein B